MKANPSQTIARADAKIPRDFIPKKSDGNRSFYPPSGRVNPEVVAKKALKKLPRDFTPSRQGRSGYPAVQVDKVALSSHLSKNIQRSFIGKTASNAVVEQRVRPRENSAPVKSIPMKNANSQAYGKGVSFKPVKFKAPSRDWKMFQDKGVNA